MKRSLTTLALILLALTAATAGTLPQEQVAADAKWLLHFDLAGFRSTKVGGYVMRQLLEKQLQQPLADVNREFKLGLDPTHILDKVGSFTLYGPDFQSAQTNAVLLIRVDPDMQQVLVGALAGLALAGTNAPLDVKQTQIGEVSFYAAKNSFFGAILPGKVMAIGRSRAMIEKAANVLAGKAPNLTSSKTFTEFGDLKQAYFFLAVAEGFSSSTALPVQARMLQMADGGRLTLGEEADRMLFDLALRAKSPETASQMQQVIQGLIALGSLGQPEDKNITTIMQSLKVWARDNVVGVSLQLPVELFIQELAKRTEKEALTNTPASMK